MFSFDTMVSFENFRVYYNDDLPRIETWRAPTTDGFRLMIPEALILSDYTATCYSHVVFRKP